MYDGLKKIKSLSKSDLLFEFDLAWHYYRICKDERFYWVCRVKKILNRLRELRSALF